MRPNILASIPAGGGEVYLDIHGSELGNLVTFEGPAGAFKIEPQLAETPNKIVVCGFRWK